MSNLISVEQERGTAIIRFTNAGLRNPLSRDVLNRLYELVDHISEPIIFTGSNNVFASGANLNEIRQLDRDSAPEFARFGQGLMSRIAALPQMTIAAINGYCFGGALDLALSCDVRIASTDAQFSHPGAGLGIITGWGGTQRLPRLIGTSAALEMFFTAEAVNSSRAITIGLVDEVVADPLDRALRIIDQGSDALH